MKKLSLIITTFLLASLVFEANAQSATVKKIASYSGTNSTGASTFVGKNNIYYVEVKNKNNAIKKIDCKTGEVSVVVPGIEGIYEGARPVIESVWECGGTLFFVLKKGGVFMWDGKSVETSKKLPDSWDVMACTNRYILASSIRNNITTYVLMDMQTRKVENIIPYDNSWGKKCFISSDGSVWNMHTNFNVLNEKGETIDVIEGYGAEKVKGKKHTYYDLRKLPYVSMSDDERGHYLNWGDVVQRGDSLYVAVSRRIYRLDMLAEHPQWEEFARIPSTLPGQFNRICINARGDMLTYYNQYAESDVQLWKAGHFDKPQNLGRKLSTGFKEMNWDVLSLAYAGLWVDANDNFVINDNSINIWNPDGVVGYEVAKGKIYKVQ